MRRAYICRDYALDAVLDEVARALEGRGLDVTRGPAATPGHKTVIEPSDYARRFSTMDVAMFSSRNPAPAELLRAAPRLRGIVNPSIGLDGIDLEAASELGIIVGHGAVPENYLGMAEATVMLMLNLRYQLAATLQVMAGARPRPPLIASALHARMLRGCTVGFVGMGRIARAVVDLLRPFGVRMVAHSPSTDAQHFAPDVARVGFDELMATSDIVGLFASLDANSRGSIDDRALSLMKRDAYLVNTARGELVDEAALHRALSERRIAGAALDVFANEPLPPDSPLRGLDNAILTPHLVGCTQDMAAALVPAALENIDRLLRGELPLHCRNPQAEGRWRARLQRLDA